MIINVKIDRNSSHVDSMSGYSAYLSFAYNQQVLDVVRTIEPRYWNKDAKQWEIPAEKLNIVTEEVSKMGIGFLINGFFRANQSPVDVELPAEFQFKTKPFGHQIDGVKYGLKNNRWLLGDEQGLGKTKQVIDIAVCKRLIEGYRHCLIVCGVNGLKWNWIEEIKTHSDTYGRILGLRANTKSTYIGSSADKLADAKKLGTDEDTFPYFIITNVETLRNNEIADVLSAKCRDKTIGIVAIDEIHKCKNPGSQQGKAILKLQSECRIAMTGTPLMNTPLDLYIILKWLGYEYHSFYKFKQYYAEFGGYGGHEIIRYKHLGELERNLRNHMLRRKKEEVLDLPEKLYVNEYVDMTPKQAQVYKEVTQAIKANIDQISISPNPLAELIRMRQATGYTGILSSKIQESAKIDRMEELIAEAISNGKKVVVFSNWTQMTDPICQRLENSKELGDDITYELITGQTSAEDRMRAVNAFQSDNACKVIVGTVGAMGTGLTLTAGTVVIFMDEPWTMAAKQQAEDRCHRIGSTENITIYTIMAKNTIDERIHEIVENKGEMADKIVDGKIEKANKVDFLKWLIG